MNEAVKFLKGTQAQFEALCTAGRYQPGAFYLVIDDTAGATADSLGKPGRLYYGVNSTNIAPVNQGITNVETTANLPTPNALNAGNFYYVSKDNILCISNGKNWVQTNVDTTLSPNDSSIEVGSANKNEATITQVIADSSGNSITQVHTLVGGEHITLNVDTRNNTVTFKLDGIDYKLHSSTENVSTEDTAHKKLNIILKNDGLKNPETGESIEDPNPTKVTIIPSDNLNFEVVDANTNQYKLILDNKIDDFTADNGARGFDFAISGNAVSGLEGRISQNIDPVITYGVDKPVSVHFADGAATLNVYTKDEINNLNRTLNAMVYRGAITRIADGVFTFENTNYTTSNLHNGDVFIYNDANESLYNGYKVRQGDLFIASGEEGTDGLIPSDGLTWVYVPSADEPLVEIGDTLGANKSNPNFSIFRGLDDELLTFEIDTDNSLQVEAVTTNKTKVVTLKHVATKKSNATAISKTLEYGSNDSLEITIQDPTEIDSNGHILQVTPKTYTLKDTHAIIKAAPHTGDGNALTPVINVDATDIDLGPIEINSKTLAVECVNGSKSDNGAVTAAQINVELQWGSF